jgi:isopenicillin N synthase-like dioxygenase
MHSIPRQASAEEVPVLDLAPWLAGGEASALPGELYKACLGTGFFYIKGHGISRAVIDDAFNVTRRYFDIPHERRLMDIIDERFRRGFMPVGVNQHPGYAPDLKESYEISMDLPLTDPDVVAAKPLHGPNRWPDHAPWFRPAAEAYFNETLRLGKDMLRLFALALDQDEGFFQKFCTKPMVQSRFFHYPSQPAVEEAHGVAPHTDYGMITILAQDPIGGLELLKRDGEWVSAPYIDGTLIVNLGDMFKVWTNDVFVSNLHRVVNRTGKERYSIPTFFNLDYDAPVACLHNFQTVERPAKHKPTRSGDYLVQRFKEVQGFKAS